MSVSTPSDHRPELLRVPDSLKEQLSAFRGRVWLTKMAEAVAMAVAAVLVAFLVVFLVDRVWDTPQSIRLGIFVATVAIWFAVPWALHRWVWRHRRMDQLARLLRVREPNIGDQLLGVIELADSDTEQARSRDLCAAAIKQVAESAKQRDLNEAAPRSRVKLWGSVVAVTAVGAAVLFVVAGPAARNAWARLSAPWYDTPRYTFTQIQPLDDNYVVPHGETVAWTIMLDDDSRWEPDQATIQIEGLPTNVAKLQGRKYQFELPPRTAPTEMLVSVGDYYQTVALDPKIRPELIGANAAIQLPDYLQIPGTLDEDVRSGTLSVVQGSRATLTAKASRELASASINDQSVSVAEDSFSSQAFDVKLGQMLLSWKDRDGLAGREPFELVVKPAVDEPPSVVTQDFPRQAVLLDSEQLNFKALSADDFGVKRLGISWKGLDDRLTEPANGEKVIATGGPEKSSLQVPATFSAVSLGIEPQPIEIRLWAEDYLPGRGRVFSAPHIFFVLTPDQHAIWITNQMSKWHRASLDVRDREMRLHERNKQLREMTPEQLADEAMRKELRKQAAAEASNGRRLSALTKAGTNLLRQASRNPEIGVGHLDRWAEMLQILDDISGNRMPSVSDLLENAATKPKLARGGGKPKEPAPQAGKNRSKGGGSGSEEDEEKTADKDKPKIPSIVDMESSQQPKEEDGENEDPQKQPEGKPRLTLPVTTIAGPPPKSEDEQPEEEETEEPVDEAIQEQKDLLAEFEKIADELNTLLANMEGSTLVKRLKAASREQNQVAERIGGRIDAVFGRRAHAEKEDRDLLKDLAEVESNSVEKISYIMDDMQAYYERRRMNQFKSVLDEMRAAEVLTALEDLGQEIPKQQGMSIAQAEFWSDNFDRWADDLVDPASGGM